MAKISQYFKDKAKTIKDYPKTLIKAVYGDDGKRLDNIISDITSDIDSTKAKIGTTDISKYSDGTVTGAIKAACDKSDANETAIADVNSNFNNFGSWTPTIEHGTITDSACQYYKIGKLVTLFCAIWGSGDGTDNDVSISIPFPSISFRAYGSVGYFPGAVNYPNLHVIIANENKLIFEYSGGDDVKHINGKQWGICQFSITYLTN